MSRLKPAHLAPGPHYLSLERTLDLYHVLVSSLKLVAICLESASTKNISAIDALRAGVAGVDHQEVDVRGALRVGALPVHGVVVVRHVGARVVVRVVALALTMLDVDTLRAGCSSSPRSRAAHAWELLRLSIRFRGELAMNVPATLALKRTIQLISTAVPPSVLLWALSLQSSSALSIGASSSWCLDCCLFDQVLLARRPVI